MRRYAEPAEYERWTQTAAELGFLASACGPLVRSSYRAGALYRQAVLQRKLAAK